jgi:ketosteroid isomerase-like protein
MPSRGLALFVAGLLLAPSALAAPSFAQDATPSAECAVTTEDQNKEIVQAFFAAAANGDAAGIAENLAPDHVYHELSVDVPLAAPDGSPEGAKAWSDERKEAITDLAVTVDPIIADGNQVSSMMHWSGKDADTGAEVNWTAAGFFDIECGKMVETWIVTDSLGRLMTSGDITADELAQITAEGTPVP